MKKISGKLLKIVMLISMIFSSFQTPIYVLANELTGTNPLASTTPEKGDMKLGENGEITKENSVSITAGSKELTKEGDVQVTKTVSKVEGEEGKYKVDFLIKGKKYINETTTVKNSYTVFVLDASSSMKGEPWTKAKEAAISFSDSFVKAGKNNYLALVTFNTNGYQKRDFQNAVFTNDNLGNTSTGTNYNAGLSSAYNYLNALSNTEKENASLNIIFISDGEPHGSSYSDTLSNIKSMGVNIYTFAYNLDPKKDYNAYNILKNISTDDNVTSIESSNIDSILEGFIDKVTIPTPAGTNATLTDGIGEQFKIITENNKEVSGYGVSYKSANIPEITEEGTLVSFYVEINKDAPTGWHQTNDGFKLEYTDASGKKQTINCNEDPYVYWVQAQYDYVVNYYKDSITESNLLATETRQAPAGTIINEGNVDKNKYLNQVSSSYEFSSLTPESITITNDGNTNIINVLYVKVYGNLIVKHVDEKGNDLLPMITTTKEINTNYTTEVENIYGYTSTGIPSNANGTYVKGTTTVTYVYTKNDGKVENNDVIKTQINPIIGANSTFKYVLSYEGKVKDYLGTATVTLKDTLPYEIENIEYDTESCTYNQETRLLTCTKTVELNENNQLIEARFDIEVTYKNLVNTTNLNVLNKVSSSLTFGETEITDESEVTDVIKSGTVIATYVDEENNELSSSVTTTGLIDNTYETTEKTIYGYTLKEVKGNETGLYTEETIEVIYVYTKNEGTIETNEVTKVGPENITSVDGVFNYTLTYNGKITNYVGNATLTLKDTLPYEIDEELSSFSGCTYENKILTCTKEYTIDELNQEINAEFNLSLVFKNIDSNKITNKVESTIKFGNKEEKDNDEIETEVFKGNVIVTYKNKQGESLTENIKMEDLAGNTYETEAKEFLGYTLTKNPDNKTGVYVANQTIYVNYIYDKNIGTSEEHLEKQGIEIVSDINSPFEYKITYKLEIFDYVGEAKIILTDYLPYEIDEEKSSIGDTCEYIDGKIICEYSQNIIDEDTSKINIEENFILYYKDITTNKVTNRIESQVIYGESEKFDEDEFTTEIPYGTLKVNYVTEDGEKLSQTIVATDLVGKEYITEQKVFDDYYLKEVIGNKTGTYTEEDTEVTYVYSLIPLPPQTGVDSNSTINYLGILIFATIILVLKRRYL